jgi:hypothetical protein
MGKHINIDVDVLEVFMVYTEKSPPPVLPHMQQIKYFLVTQQLMYYLMMDNSTPA